MRRAAVALSSAPRVPFAQCYIAPGARAQALDVMTSGWLTAGERTQQFETRFAGWLGARNAVAVSSCTAAIELALRALDLPPGAPVLSPTLTFCGAVEAIVHAGLKPVLIDTDDTLTVDPAALDRARARRPAAMIVQHMAGYPLDVQALADAAGIPLDRVIDDAAHGLGASRDGRYIGTTSRASCFSFHATKNLPIGEGGAVTTGDDDFAERLRIMRQHGMSRDAWRRYDAQGTWRYDVECAGLKANFTDLQAAIGLGQLVHLKAWQVRREQLASRYDAALRDVPGIVLPPRPPRGTHAWDLYIVRVRPPYPLSRDHLVELLAQRGIATSVHFIPVHRFGYFRRLLGDLSAELVNAEAVADEVLSLPLHPLLSDDDVDDVCSQIAKPITEWEDM